jgi:hypothetical protein
MADPVFFSARPSPWPEPVMADPVKRFFSA